MTSADDSLVSRVLTLGKTDDFLNDSQRDCQPSIVVLKRKFPLFYYYYFKIGTILIGWLAGEFKNNDRECDEKGDTVESITCCL